MLFQKFRNRVESLIVLLDLIRSTYYLISLSRYSSLYSGSQVICINALLCMHTSTWNFRITLKNGQKKITILGTLGWSWNFQVEKSNFVDIKNISYSGKTALGIVQFMVKSIHHCSKDIIDFGINLNPGWRIFPQLLEQCQDFESMN